jgi:hypothetical protein
MAQPQPWPMLRTMEHRTVTITLRVEVAGDDVRGSAHAGAPAAANGAGAPGPAGESRAFAGWLGLIGAIDALLGFPPDKGAAARALATRDGASR